MRVVLLMMVCGLPLHAEVVEIGLRPIAPYVVVGADGTLSVPYITYHNVALTLAGSGLKLKTVANNPEYREEAQQIAQIRMLFSRRTQVIVGDSRIFSTLTRSLEMSLPTSAETIEYELFPPSPYSVVFRSPLLATDFNAGLAQIRANGLYDKILSRYR